tara:strand:+ start:371 stop:1351 length:981 start_codon:yes stop_codon:yes gene_type:complete
MATRAQKTRLAFFFIFSISVLTGFILVVAGSHLFKSRTPFIIRFENIGVGGLNKGASVKYLGTTIGRVEDVYIDSVAITTVIVNITVDPKQRNAVTEETRAAIGTLGITGLKYITLIPGSAAATPLPEGATIEGDETFLADFEKQAEVLSAKVELVLDRVNLLFDEQNRRNFTKTLASTGDLTQNTSDLIRDNRANINQVFDNLASMTQSLSQASAMLQATSDSLHHILTGSQTRNTLEDIGVTAHHVRQMTEGPLPQLIANLTQMTENIDKTFIHVDQTVLQSRTNILNAMQDLEVTLQNFRETTEIIRDNPSVLLRGGSRTDGR